MAGFNSQAGQVGFGIQSVKGTPNTATRFSRLRSGSLGGNRALLIPNPEIGGHRDIPEAYMGPVGYGGTLEFYPRMQMLALLLRAALGTSSDSSVAGSNEVQTLTMTGTPTGGSFQVRFRGENSGAIAFNAAAAAVQTALQAMTGIGAGNVTCTGGPFPGTPVVVTFAAALAATNPAQFTIVNGPTGALTGGTTPTIVPTTTTPGTPTIGTHVITPGQTIPWLTVEERIGVSLESFRYTDSKVNSLKLSADANGFLMGSADLIAIHQDSDFTAQSNPAWDQTPQMVGGQVAVQFNGATFLSKSFNFEVNNNIETDDFYLGQVELGDAVEKRRELKLGFTYRPQDSSLMKSAMYGDSTYTFAKAGRAYRGPVKIVMTSFETIGNIVAGTPFSSTLELPNCVIAPFSFSPSGDDVIQNDLELTPIRPDSNESILTATVVNDLATAV